MKKHAIGISGIVFAVVLALWLVVTKGGSAAGNMTRLDLGLAVVILGMVAAVRGSILWFLLSLVGILEVLFVIF
ncbi:MAG TPA: hypothetical protein VFU68_00425 [Terracidiphilus sp.]|nr:hypothetical protein [Terracidiphilus sp.]